MQASYYATYRQQTQAYPRGLSRWLKLRRPSARMRLNIIHIIESLPPGLISRGGEEGGGGDDDDGTLTVSTAILDKEQLATLEFTTVQLMLTKNI